MNAICKSLKKLLLSILRVGCVLIRQQHNQNTGAASFFLLESGYCGVITIENNNIVEEMYSTCSQVVIIYFLHKLAVYLDYAFYD